MEKHVRKMVISFIVRLRSFCTDNAAMIGVAAYYEYMKGTDHGWEYNAGAN